MKHLTISDYGRYLGLKGDRLVVEDHDQQLLEVTLNRLKTLTVAKKGVTLSSNVLMACAQRGIQVFFVDYRGQHLSSLHGLHHRVARLRQHQFAFLEQPVIGETAARMIQGKLRNQRAVLRYFAKSANRSETDKTQLVEAATQINTLVDRIKATPWQQMDQWRDVLFGLEGQAATVYWQVLQQSELLTPCFEKRHGRHATDISNKLLNYGYAILSSWIWQALNNAGMEVFAGLLHTQRPGKPALVLDMMEEYRAWCVDRIVIKMRPDATGKRQLTPALKKRLINEMHTMYEKHYHYNKKRLRLESIMQRQAYRLAGVFAEQKQYKPYTFKW